MFTAQYMCTGKTDVISAQQVSHIILLLFLTRDVTQADDMKQLGEWA